MSPLDKIFKDIETWLKSDHQSQSGGNTPVVFDSLVRILDWISEIQKITNATTATPAAVLPRQKGGTVDSNAAKDIISISLHDMKLFNWLLRVLIIQGIHPCLDQGVGVPLSVRMKPGSGSNSADQTAALNSSSNPPMDDQQKLKQLSYLVERLVAILKTGGDVRDLILIGSYSSDLLSASIQMAYKYGDKPQYKSLYLYIKSQIDTYNLFACYTSLLRPNSPKWFIQTLTRELAMIPLDRPKDGVRSLIEFTSSLREKDALSPNDLDHAVKVLKSVPKGIDTEVYARSLGVQLLDLLGTTSSNSPFVPAAVYIAEAIEQQRSELIAKGLQHELVDTFYPPRDIDIVPDVRVEKCLFAISALLKGQNFNVSPMMQTLIKEVLVKIWLLYCFMSQTKRPTGVVKDIIVTMVNITDDKDSSGLNLIGKALLDSTSQFTGGENGGVAIKNVNYNKINPEKVVSESFLEQFSTLDQRIDLFMDLASNIDDEALSKMFTTILQRWLTTEQLSVFQETDPLSTLADVKLLQRISQDEKNKLLKSSTEIVQVITTLIKEYALGLEVSTSRNEQEPLFKINNNSSNLGTTKQQLIPDSNLADSDDEDEDKDSDDEDEGAEKIEAVKICLNLVSMFLSEPDVLTSKDISILLTIEPALQLLTTSNQVVAQLQSQATRTLALLKAQQTSEDGDADNDKPDGSSDDLAVYQKALKALEDPTVPIRAHGLHLLKSLAQSKAAIVGDGTALLKIFLSQLNDEDSFIYLNCIKGIESVVYAYGAKMLHVLLGYYSDKTVALDQRLKCGEAILRVIQSQGKVFDKDTIGEMVDTFISIVSRSGAKKDIVGAGDQDNRLRMSSMSLLGMLCEENPLGLIPWLDYIMDCAIGILTFETQADEVSAIMRRSTVVLLKSLYMAVISDPTMGAAVTPAAAATPVMSTINGAKNATANGTQKSQLGILMNRLKNIRVQDPDPIVRDQANSVLEMVEGLIN